MSENPYDPPTGSVLDSPDDETWEIARAQRMLILAILASLGGNYLLMNFEAFGLFLIPLSLAILGFCIYGVYRLARALDLTPVVWIIAMFVPLINLISLFLLNGKATRHLKAKGIRVGLMGADI